jgi:hypothetical protein
MIPSSPQSKRWSLPEIPGIPGGEANLPDLVEIASGHHFGENIFKLAYPHFPEVFHTLEIC